MHGVKNQQCDSQDDLPNNEIWTRCNNPKWTYLDYPNGKWY